MTFDQLKQTVQEFIGKANIDEAIKSIKIWAHQNNQEQLKNDVTLLNGDWTDLKRERNLGIISGSDASLRQAQLNHKILNLLTEFGIGEPGGNTSILKKIPESNNKSKIYFSYAWGDDEEIGESREKIVSELYGSLKEEGYHVIRDKEDSKYGDLISDILKEIGTGDFIIVAISDKYLKSENCMFEMFEIYRNSKFDKKLFKEKIYPVRVESLKLSDPKVLATYFKYWEQKEQEWGDLINNFGTRISSVQHEDFKRIKSMASELGEFLKFLSDINAKSTEQLSKNNFEEIKKAIQSRIS